MNRVNEWESLYQEYGDDVYRFLMYFIGNRNDAEDLLNETFIKVFRNLHQFDNRSGIKTWILSISRNVALDHIRKKERLKALNLVLQKEPVDDPQLPDHLLQMNERKRILYEAIQSLIPNYRIVVILRGIQEFSLAEIASILGWKESKVKITLHRAMKALREILEKEVALYGMDT
ncbi:RNA polymerase [Effusibacillus lacus]|uniref:RNA polymerase n=1 Tax=Effusibacillus lacus TaxID=1348429 RepID=A0A292YJ27_9BACL|nr:RNA polymerase [Effusibacillus lacus]